MRRALRPARRWRRSRSDMASTPICFSHGVGSLDRHWRRRASMRRNSCRCRFRRRRRRPPGAWRSCSRVENGSGSAPTWMRRRWRGSSRLCRADDAVAERSASLVGDRPYRHAQRFRRPGADRSRDAETRSALWTFVRVPGSSRRFDKMPVMGRTGALPVLETVGERPVHLACGRRRRRHDLDRAAWLSLIGD